MTLRNLKAEATKLDATVDDSTLRSGFVNVDAPAGKVWACSGDIHALCVQLEYDERPDRAFAHEAIKDAIERMGHGLAECDDPDCDVCREEQS